MVEREEKERLLVMVGLWVNPVPTDEEVQTEAVPVFHPAGQDAQEERILIRTACFIFQEQKNPAIQAHRIQQKSRVNGDEGLQ